MKQDTKDKLIFYGQIFIKVITTAMFMRDTWNVTRDVFAVLLMDAMMFFFWMLAAYGGNGKLALATRPFGAVGAWALWGAQLYIGWEAHHTLWALIARTSPALALAYDTYQYAIQFVMARKQEQNRDKRHASWRAFALDIGYVLFVVVSLPVAWVGSALWVFVDYFRDMGLAIVPARDHVSSVRTVNAQGVQMLQAPSRLTPNERREQVHELIREQPTLTQDEIADALGVSRATISRDLASLKEE